LRSWEDGANTVEKLSVYRKGGRITAEKENEVLARLAVGEPQTSIARATGVSRSSVVNMSRKHADQIRALHEELLDALPNAVGTVKDMITSYSDPQKRMRMSSEEKKYAFGFTMELLKSTGMLGGAPPAVLVQNFFQDNKTVIIDPTVRDVLGRYVDDIKKISQEGSDVIDLGEPESPDSDFRGNACETRRDETYGGKSPYSNRRGI
jgi:hypothetical protein